MPPVLPTFQFFNQGVLSPALHWLQVPPPAQLILHSDVRMKSRGAFSLPKMQLWKAMPLCPNAEGIKGWIKGVVETMIFSHPSVALCVAPVL